MLFGELKVGDKFTRKGSNSLVWSKARPFTAYGFLKDQNAMTYAKPNGPWRYEKMHDDEEVFPVETK